MASPAKAKSDIVLGLSQSEVKILLLGMIATNKDGKVDYEILAQKGGWKNGSSASTMYRNAKRKFLELHGGDGEENSAAAGGAPADTAANTPKKTPAKRKKTAATATDPEAANDGDDEEIDTPTKSKRQRKAPVKKGGAKGKKAAEEELAAKTEKSPEPKVKDEDETELEDINSAADDHEFNQGSHIGSAA